MPSPDKVKQLVKQFIDDAQRSWQATVDKHNLADEYKQQWNPNMQALLTELEQGQRQQAKPQPPAPAAKTPAPAAKTPAKPAVKMSAADPILQGSSVCVLISAESQKDPVLSGPA